jgi:hypothetical protein
MREMVTRGWTGNKAGQGFYKKVRGEGGKSEYQVLDYNTLEYKPAQKVRFPSLDAAKTVDDTAERIRALVYGKDRVGEFLWKTISANPGVRDGRFGMSILNVKTRESSFRTVAAVMSGPDPASPVASSYKVEPFV